MFMTPMWMVNGDSISFTKCRGKNKEFEKELQKWNDDGDWWLVTSVQRSSQ